MDYLERIKNAYRDTRGFMAGYYAVLGGVLVGILLMIGQAVIGNVQAAVTPSISTTTQTSVNNTATQIFNALNLGPVFIIVSIAAAIIAALAIFGGGGGRR